MKINNILEGYSKLVVSEFRGTPEYAQERIKICVDSKCQFFSTFVYTHCKKCGCVLKAKVLVKNEHCPIKKW